MDILLPMLTTLGIWDSLSAFGNAIMTPLYWVVSGLLVLFHVLWSPLLGAASGWTWALSIISLTVIIRVALIPLFVRQIHSSRNLQLLQPQMRELQKKWGHDRERLGQETMKLYKEQGVNPAASCLPLILQMPIFFALFHVLNSAANGRASGTWLIDRPELVTSLQEATVFGARISDKFWPLDGGFGGVQVLTIILIVLMTITLFITQLQLMRKNMPPEALTGPMAQQQKIMLYMFPVIFAIGGVNFPVGVLIYWLTSNLWTMAQQFYVIRRNPAPNTPAYAAWEVRQRAKGKEIEAPQIRSTNKRTTTLEKEPLDPTRPQRQLPRQQPRKQTRSKRKP